MQTLLLIDAHAMIHRAYHALPDTLRTSDGRPTNAIYGFFLMLTKVIGDFKPTHIAIAFDTPTPTFRKKLYKEYQIKRPPMENLLKVQIPIIKDLIGKSGIFQIERPGFEADDVIGTLSTKFKDSFDRILILTGDRDLLQLTTDHTFLIAPKNGVSNFDLFTSGTVFQKYGGTPSHFTDYKALVGDSSDGYITAKGIGPKSAKTLLEIHPTIEKLLSNLNDVENKRLKQILSDSTDKIKLFKKIATIVCNLNIENSKKELIFEKFNDKLKVGLQDLELYSLIQKVFATSVKNNVPLTKKKVINKTTDQIGLF